MIAARLQKRNDHFMPPELLASQFEAPEMPTTAEHVVTVPIDADVESIVSDIVRRLAPRRAAV